MFCDVPFKRNKILKQRGLLFLQHIKRRLGTHVSATPSSPSPDMQLRVTRKLLSVSLTLRFTFVCLQVRSESECFPVQAVTLPSCSLLPCADFFKIDITSMPHYIVILHALHGDRGSTVVKVLCYKSEGRWFDPSFCLWIFH